MEQNEYDVFLSYSRKDYLDEQKNVILGNEVSKIKEALTKAGITYWFDEKGIIPGEDYAAKIVKHIKASKIFVYLSSEAANDSEWTRKEIACALMYKKYLIPVLLDDSPFHDSVILRIVDIDRIDYYLNPSQGLEKLTQSINANLEEERAKAAEKAENEKRKKETLERQRREQEKEKKRQAEIEKYEVEISAQESRRTELKKVVLQKEQELKMAQVDVEACEAQILKLQSKIEVLRASKKKTVPKENFLEIKLNDTISFRMIRVNGGTFKMGATVEQGEFTDSDEVPVHLVTLQDFFICETVVTQAQWQALMGNNPSKFVNPNFPVECVSWDDCQLFIKKLNKKTGKQFRLPTEAEWEYAARGGKSGGYKYSGSNNIYDIAWYSGNSEGQTHIVKTRQANELGIFDMCGNVWEWCQDWEGSYSETPQTNPLGPSEGTFRICRGGSWQSNHQCSRVSFRESYKPQDHYYDLGFRLAL